MTRQKQARILMHSRRIALELSMKDLAAKAGHSREAVSRALNHGHNPGVLRRVKEVLGV